MAHGKSKIESQQIRRQGHSDQRETVGESKTGLAIISQGAGSESERVPGTIGARRGSTVPRDVAGKIVDELIAAQEKRMQESQECIEWYQREYEFAAQKIEELQGLRQLIAGDEAKDEPD